MHTRAARLARASVTASVSTLVTAVSHAVAGGSAPHPLLLLVAFALALLFCLALTGRRLSPSRLLLAVAVSQAMLHAVFATAGPPPDALLSAALSDAGTSGVSHATGMPGMPGMSGMYHGVSVHGVSSPAFSSAAHAAGLDVGMLLAHILAGLVTALALTVGERAFWGHFDSLRLAGSALLRLVTIAETAPARPAGQTSLVVAEHVLRPRTRERLMLALRHRGPPVFAA